MAEKRTGNSTAGGGAGKGGKRTGGEAARGKEGAAGRPSAGGAKAGAKANAGKESTAPRSSAGATKAGAKASAGKSGASSGGRDERVRQRAYQIWEQEGRPAGKEREHWERANRDVGK